MKVDLVERLAEAEAEIARADYATRRAVERLAEATLACGHPASLLLRSTETGEPLYCELCDDKSGRRDAEHREVDLQARLAEANALLREESHEHHRFTQMTEYPAVTRMLLWHMDRKRRIDAHLAREGKP
jgi:hypothetical protein